MDRYLARAGLDERLEQAAVIEEWARLVGPQIAGVTTPDRVGADGTLFVRVTTAAWAQELQMQSVEVLKKLRSKRIRRIAWRVG